MLEVWINSLVCHRLCIDFGTGCVALLCLSTASVKWTTSQGIREGCTEGCEELSFSWLSQLVLAWSLETASFLTCTTPLLLLFDDYLLTSVFPF